MAAPRDALKPQIDRQKTTPFHLKLFYRVNSFHPLSDFAIPSSPSSYSGPTSGPNAIRARSPPPVRLPPHLEIYTWQSCTLRELTQLLTSALPSLLPDPAVGTRICFRLIYPDTKGATTMGGDARGRYLSKDVGSVVVGPKDSPYRGENDEENGGSAATGPRALRLQGNDADKTLQDFRFVIGDYVDCAILPVVEVALSGYAMLDQIGTGLRQRIYSRSFIFANPNQPDDTFIYIVIDAVTGDTAVRHGVLQALASLGGDYARYGERNVALTGTHSHSGPGAWNNYLLPQIPSKGFDKQSYQAIVDGVVLSIKRAHESLALGRLSFGSIDVENANINRSPYSYDANPEEEKARYSANVDKTMTLLRFDRESDNRTTAILTFFPVHGTSLYNNNTLTTGDNKGVAAWLFERSVQDDANFADDFVAGFSQSNVGDTSPNVLGAWCEDGSGQMCRYSDSTCGGKTEDCHGRGPFFREKDNGAKSCFEIGRLQYAAAKQLYSQMDTSNTRITGNSNVRSFHAYRDLAGYTFQSPFNSSMLTTCSAALGFSFAAGTTDGPGLFDFTQNSSGPAESNPLWYVARAFVHQPSAKQKACQAPKDILLDVGANTQPYAWEPNIVDIQVLRVGQLFLIISTSEATTMAGRRWKEAIAKSAKDVLSIDSPLVVLGAPSNSYAHYVTTEEEYSRQRYEGASTLYGPHTLAAYINLTLTYLPYLGDSPNPATLPEMPTGVQPPINTDKSLSFIPGVVYDSAPIGKSFGDVVASVAKSTYKPGETVNTTFVGANPRNNLRQESTFAAVEWQNPASGRWEVVRTDNDWNLLYHWKRTNTILGYSEVTLEWQIEDDYYNTGNPKSLQAGTYRFHYYGDAKNIQGQIKSFEGIGKPFTVNLG